MSVCVALLRPLVREMTRRGLEPWPLLCRIGVDELVLTDSRKVVPIDAFEETLNAAISACRDSTLGLAAAQGFPIETLLGLGPLFLACDDLLQALTMLAHCAPVFSQRVSWSTHRHSGTARFIFQMDELVGPARRYMNDFMAVLIYRLAASLLNSHDEQHLTLRMPYERPRDLTLYRQVFACPIEFGGSAGELIVPEHFLSLPNVHADSFARVVYRDCVDRARQAERKESCSERVRLAIRGGQVKPLCLVAIARALRTSPRALRTRLAREGSSATKLIAEERARMACRKLGMTAVSISALSLELGFSDTSSFYRAFKRWKGVSPAEYARSRASHNDSLAR